MTARTLALSVALCFAGCALTPNDTPPPTAGHAERAAPAESTGATALPELIPAASVTEVPEPVLAQPTDLWERMRQGFALEADAHPRVDSHLRWYRTHPSYLDRVFTRADPYLHHIVSQVEARDMPTEIALLPVVESAFDPFAYSHGRAAGLWQFIPGTGKRFGLKQNWWYDGRRDVLASTEAALDYLEYLHQRFDGDWMLALAAYNSGEGTVQRAMRKNRKAGKPTDFWNLSLPRETRSYVPKLLALKEIVDQSDIHDVQLPDIPNETRIGIVDTGGQLDLAIAARLADLPLEDLYRLNPGFNRWATDPDGPHHLVLPREKVEPFAKALAALPAEDRVRWVRHEIRSGETLIEISNRYHTTVPVLQEANQLAGHQIRTGRHLLVPVATHSLDRYALSADQRLAQLQNRQRKGIKLSHKVRAGDTLWELARTYDVSVRQLAGWNGMAPGDTLRQGQNLVVWSRKGGGLNEAASTVRPVHYTVRRGDSLSRISHRFKVSVTDLRRWNALPKGKYLQPGQRLKLYVDVTRQTES
jgi:membrane-bound lytic murein transglycosylase D